MRAAASSGTVLEPGERAAPSLRTGALVAVWALLAACAAEPGTETVVRPATRSPLVAIRLVVEVGSAHDPPGKEGLAALTGLMLAEGSTLERTYPEILDRLYPTAAAIEVRTDREVTLFETLAHRDTLDEITTLFVEALTRPAFDARDFERNRARLRAELDTTLRNDDELLGLELLQQVVFEGHPYGHAPAGTLHSLERLTVEDVRRFYASFYTRDRLLLGVGGGMPEGYAEQLGERLAVLPRLSPARQPMPPAPELEGRHLTLVRKESTGIGIHLGFPLLLDRTDEDWVPLLVATTILGDHRSFHGRLMQELRNVRGLNYGDYAYLEHFHLPPATTSPTPNVPRRRQYFSIWLRPVAHESAPFALRAALFELDRLITAGVTDEEVAAASTYLRNRSKLWALDVSSRIGFELDDRFYGMPSVLEELDRRLPRLGAAEVNDAIRAHLSTDDLQIVLVGDRDGTPSRALEVTAAEPPPYPTPPDEATRAEDRRIVAIDLDLATARSIGVDELFVEPGLPASAALAQSSK